MSRTLREYLMKDDDGATQKRLGALEARTTQLTEKIAELKQANAVLTQENASFKEDVTAAKKEVAETKKTLEEQEKAFKVQLTEVEKTTTTLQEEKGKVEKENASLKEKQERNDLLSAATKHMGDYKFKNTFEKLGFENSVLQQVDGKYLSDDQIMKLCTDFLKDAQPPTEGSGDKPPAANSGDKPPTGASKNELAQQVVTLLSKPKPTFEEIKQIKTLQNQIETME